MRQLTAKYLEYRNIFFPNFEFHYVNLNLLSHTHLNFFIKQLYSMANFIFFCISYYLIGKHYPDFPLFI